MPIYSAAEQGVDVGNRSGAYAQSVTNIRIGPDRSGLVRRGGDRRKNSLIIRQRTETELEEKEFNEGLCLIQ